MRMANAFISGVFATGLAALRGGDGEGQGDTKTTSPTSVVLVQGGVMRKSWRMDKAGRITDLNLVEEPLVAPGPGEARIKVKAIGLNMADIFAIIGLYGATPPGSFIPGLEYSGVVDFLGPPSPSSPSFSTLKIGDPVYGFTRFGAYTSHLNVPLAYLRSLPPSFSFAQGASFVVQGLTAWHAIVELGNLQNLVNKYNKLNDKSKSTVSIKRIPPPSVLVHSAAGGVGCFALEICKKLGAFPIATIGSGSKKEFLRTRYGLREGQVLVRETDRKKFAQQLKGALSEKRRLESEEDGDGGKEEGEVEGFDLILDALGGLYFKEGYKHLARGGRMITFGAADYLSTKDSADWFKIIPRYLMRPSLDPGDMCGENKGVLGFNLIWLTDKVEELNAELDDMLEFHWDPPHVGSSFPFTQLPDAVRALQTGMTVGKVVVLID